jgi:hypothetical protein
MGIPMGEKLWCNNECPRRLIIPHSAPHACQGAKIAVAVALSPVDNDDGAFNVRV